MKRKIVLSLVLVLGLGIICYLYSDLRYSLKGDADIYALIHDVKDYFDTSQSSTIPDSVLLIDVSYDQQLVPVNKDGMEVGTVCITDRKKLFDFLKATEKSGNQYKKVLIDIRFDSNIITHEDDSLMSILVRMPRIYLPYHHSMTLRDKRLRTKAYYSDYGTSTTIFENNFVKYEYEDDNQISIPLAMSKMKSSVLGPLHFLNGRLSYNCMMIPMWVNPSSYDRNTPRWQNLGSDILLDSKRIGEITKGKVVVIGNMQEDIHNTYAGDISGSVINLNAYISLQKGLGYASIPQILTWGLLYFLCFWIIISNKNDLSHYHYIKIIKDFLHKTIKSDIIWFMLSLITSSVIISMVASCIFIFTGNMSNILLPSLYISVVSTIVKFNNRKDEKAI